MRFSFGYITAIFLIQISFSLAGPIISKTDDQIPLARREPIISAPRWYYTAAGQAHLANPPNGAALSANNNPQPPAKGSKDHQNALQASYDANWMIQGHKDNGVANGRAAVQMAGQHRLNKDQHAAIASYANAAAIHAQHEAYHRQESVKAHQFMGTSNVGHESGAIKTAHDAVAWANMAAHHNRLAQRP